MTVLTNSTDPLYSGWREVEMTDQQLAEYIVTADQDWFEKNRDLFADWEYKQLTKVFDQ